MPIFNIVAIIFLVALALATLILLVHEVYVQLYVNRPWWLEFQEKLREKIEKSSERK